jgi:hypothetical protein
MITNYSGIFELPIEDESLWLKTVKRAERDLKKLEEIAEKKLQRLEHCAKEFGATDAILVTTSDRPATWRRESEDLLYELYSKLKENNLYIKQVQKGNSLDIACRFCSGPVSIDNPRNVSHLDECLFKRVEDYLSCSEPPPQKSSIVQKIGE